MEAEHQAVLQQQQLNMQAGNGRDGGELGALRGARSACPLFGSKDPLRNKKLTAKDFQL